MSINTPNVYFFKGCKDPDAIVSLLSRTNINFKYDKDKQSLTFYDFLFEKFDKISSYTLPIIELDTSTKEYSIDFYINEFICNFALFDYKEISYDCNFDLLNKILYCVQDGFQLVSVDEHSDSFHFFIAKSNAKTNEELYYSYFDVFNEKIIPFDTFYKEKEILKEGALNINDISNLLIHNLNEKKLNYYLLKEFLEDLVPEKSFSIHSKQNGDSYISMTDFE